MYSYPCRLITHDCLVGQSDIQLLCLEKVKTLRYNLYSKFPTRLVQDFSWNHTLSEIILLKSSLPCPFSSTLLLVSPGSTSLINNLYLSPCLRICFWGAILTDTPQRQDTSLFLLPLLYLLPFLPSYIHSSLTIVPKTYTRSYSQWLPVVYIKSLVPSIILAELST